MIKLGAELIPYMTAECLCPIHKVILVENNKGEALTPLWCSKEHCLFGLRAIPWLPNYNDAYNVMEFFVEGWRVWTFEGAKPKPIRLGHKNDGDSKRVVCLPLENVDFSDMEKMERKIKTIVTFS